jgi:hypothetical protein
MSDMLSMRLWDDIPAKFRPVGSDDLSVLDDLLGAVIEAFKTYWDFDVARDRDQGVRRLQKTPESSAGRSFSLRRSGATAVEWDEVVLNLQRYTLHLITRLGNHDLASLLLQRLMPVFTVIERKILPPAGTRIRRELLRSPNPFEGDFTKRPDKLIRALLLPSERLRRT